MEHRIYLRAFNFDDYKTSILWRNDDAIWNQLGGVKYYVSEGYEKKWIEEAIFDSRNIRLAVCLKDSDTYIGNVYITDINTTSRCGESHVFIGDKKLWGQGLATEAYNMLLDYVFNERAFHRVVAYVLEDNIASCKLHEKCGYKKEGVLRESVFKGGKWHNQVVYSILEDEYRNR